MYMYVCIYKRVKSKRNLEYVISESSGVLIRLWKYKYRQSNFNYIPSITFLCVVECSSNFT